MTNLATDSSESSTKCHEFDSKCAATTCIESWQQRTNVRAEIEDLIKKHNDPIKKPPFSPPQLLVIAVLCSPHFSLSMEGAHFWMGTLFGFYRHAALKRYAVHQSLGCDFDFDKVVDAWSDAFDDSEAPLKDTSGHHIVSFATLEGRFTVPTGAGRMYLRNWLEPERKGTFPFLRLPRELRDNIYEMVFHLPKCGIGLRGIYPQGYETIITQRECDAIREESTSPWDAQYNINLQLSPLFSLLYTNRQINLEAMPVLYQINHFYFHSTVAISSFLRTIHVSCLAQLRRVHLHFKPCYDDGGYDSIELEGFVRAIKMLELCTSLKELEIVMDENDWFSLSGPARRVCGRTTKYTRVQSLPGIKALAMAVIRARRYKVRGNCPRVKAYLQSEVDRVKEAAIKAMTNKGKRRRTMRMPKMRPRRNVNV